MKRGGRKHPDTENMLREIDLKNQIADLERQLDDVVEKYLASATKNNNLVDMTITLFEVLPLIDDLMTKFSPLLHCLPMDASKMQKDAKSSLEIAQTTMETIKSKIKRIREQ
jgi:hypothetical protein